jgi:hypothetical protein
VFSAELADQDQPMVAVAVEPVIIDPVVTGTDLEQKLRDTATAIVGTLTTGQWFFFFILSWLVILIISTA